MSKRGWGGMLLGVLLLGIAAAPPGTAWGNGCANCNPGFPHYGPHDAIADAALRWLRAEAPGAAAWIDRWYRPLGGDWGASFDATHLGPTANDNWLAYTDDPDSDLQDWPNHLYFVHPRPGADDRGAPTRVATLHEWMVQNLTLVRILGPTAGVAFDHNAAYLAGLLAHYVGDLSQFGHTDDTRRDHSHPADDPADRTYHGYYESRDWNVQGLTALDEALRAAPQAPERVDDPAAESIALAQFTNARDGGGVAYPDVGGGVVTVGTDYAWALDRFVGQYDRDARFLGMRGYDAALWDYTVENQRAAVDLLARILADAWEDAADPTHLVPPA